MLRCTSCGNTWYLEVSFDLTKLAQRRLYHYCPHCKRNTFHEVLERIEEDNIQPRRDDEERGAEPPRDQGAVARPVSAD